VRPRQLLGLGGHGQQVVATAAPLHLEGQRPPQAGAPSEDRLDDTHAAAPHERDQGAQLRRHRGAQPQRREGGRALPRCRLRRGPIHARAEEAQVAEQGLALAHRGADRVRALVVAAEAEQQPRELQAVLDPHPRVLAQAVLARVLDAMVLAARRGEVARAPAWGWG
jgi:hypothetical protein